MRKFVSSLLLIIAFIMLHVVVLVGVGVLYLHTLAGRLAGDTDVVFDMITIRKRQS